MDASKVMIGGIFQYGRLLEIPFYQRAYVWDTTQWSRFLDDMIYISKTKKPFFFGSIILKDEPLTKGDIEHATEKKIVTDGQQRLTTLMIFMKVLALKTGNTGGFDAIFCFVDGTPKLLHGKYDHDDFLAVMGKKDLTPFPDEKNASQILKAFNHFVRYMEAEEVTWQAICQYAIFVNINLQADEDEQQVFDTINSPGAPLSTAELLKNYFFRKDNIQAYENDWVAVFEKNDEQRNYWLQEIFVGRRNIPLIDLFFDAFFQIMVEDKKYGVKAEDKIAFRRVDRLAVSIKEFIADYCHGDKQEMIRAMAYYAESFSRAIHPETAKTSIPSEYGIDRMNVIIFGLQTTTLIPYVLFVERNVEDLAERNAIYAILESYIMRRIVCHATTKNYNRLFTSFILNQITSAETLRAELLGGSSAKDDTTYCPGNRELRNCFHGAALVNLQTKGILYMLESRIRSAMSAVSLHGFDGYSLEHLMPKKWRNNWTHPATPSEASARDLKLLTLGNLAIIPQALNASIRDADWPTKLSGKGYKSGLKSCAAGLVTMEAVLDHDTWNEDCIRERAEWLYEQAAIIWHIDGVSDADTAEPETHPGVDDQHSMPDEQQSPEPEHVTDSEKGTIKELRRRYWELALHLIKQEEGPNGAFRNRTMSKDYWLTGYTGIPSFYITCEIKTDSAGIMVQLSSKDRDVNKSAYDYLAARKEQIESALGTKLDWWRYDQGKAAYVCLQADLRDIGIYKETSWETIAHFHAEWSKKFQDVFIPLLREWCLSHKA